MKRILILPLVILFGLFPQSIPAKAVTTLGAQIVKSDLILTKSQSPYLVTGLLQIPEGVTLKVEAGVKITFKQESGIKNFGNVIIGDSQPQEPVLIEDLRAADWFNGNGGLISGVGRSNISISNSEVISNNQDYLVFGCANLSISNSIVAGFDRIVYQQECQNFSIRNSYILNVKYLYTCAFDGHPNSFILKGNIFEGALSICEVQDRTLDTYGFTNNSGMKTIFEVSGNEFTNLPQINLPIGYDEYSFTGNNLRNVTKVRLFSYTKPGKPVITNLEGNYWNLATSESSLRSKVKIIDSNTDMTLKEAITFSPMLSTPVQLDSESQALRAKYKEQLNAKAPSLKKSTITCIKGKVTKKVTAVSPKCPTGYKKK
jgi:hypothetical protein